MNMKQNQHGWAESVWKVFIDCSVPGEFETKIRVKYFDQSYIIAKLPSH